MFCSKCGAKNNDDSKFCLSCGSPMQGSTAAPATAPAPQAAPAGGSAPKSNPISDFLGKLTKQQKTILIGAAAAVVLVIVLIIVLANSCGSSNGTSSDRRNMTVEEVVDTYIHSIETCDRDTVESLYLEEDLLLISVGGEGELEDWGVDTSKPYSKFDIIETCDEAYIEHEVRGIKIKDYEKDDEWTASHARETLYDDYNFDQMDVDVEEVYAATYNVEVEWNGYEREAEIYIICAKIDGCWYIVDTEA